MNLSISGAPYWGSDISGYKCLTNAPHDKEVFLRWTELGGPVATRPERFGQGGQMICRTAEHLGARAAFEWRADGLAFELSAPMNLLVAQPETTTLN